MNDNKQFDVIRFRVTCPDVGRRANWDELEMIDLRERAVAIALTAFLGFFPDGARDVLILIADMDSESAVVRDGASLELAEACRVADAALASSGFKDGRFSLL